MNEYDFLSEKNISPEKDIVPENAYKEEEVKPYTQSPPAEKKEKAKIPLKLIALVTVISITVSALSGMGGAFFTYKLFFDDMSLSTERDVPPDPPSQEENRTEASETPSENEATSQYIPVTPLVPEKEDEPVTEATPQALTKGEIYSEAVHSIVSIKATWTEYYNSIFGTYSQNFESKGTGFVISRNGYIITNNHVIENGTGITVTDYDGNEYPASVVGRAPSNDVAVIKIDAETLPVKIGDSSSLQVGDDVLIIGNALGELSYTFTDGIVSHLSREVKFEGGVTINMFQTNTAINNGNSGGPVYNMEGEVVGIASAKYASDQIEGLGFCIPIDDVKEMITEIIYAPMR